MIDVTIEHSAICANITAAKKIQKVGIFVVQW